MTKCSVRDLDVRGKRILVRVDWNVALHDGVLADDTRIRASLPTLRYLLAQGAAIIVCSHLGRPRGGPDPRLSLAPVAARLGEVLGLPVTLAPDCVGPATADLARALQPGQVLLLENLRFHPEEEANDAAFARRLASLAEAFVQDAFGVVHRAHASTEGVTHFLPSAAGFLLEQELERLSRVLVAGNRPSAVISGGAKVSSKLALLKNLLDKVDVLCIGGAMANTFLVARGLDVGNSLVEPDLVGAAREILAAAEQQGCRILLPVDGVVADGPDGPARARPIIFADEPVPAQQMILDVGPRTLEQFAAALLPMRVVVWNGPLGLCERPPFAGGTTAIARILAGLDAETIVCGGDTVEAVTAIGLAERMSHISTGGGAALELLEGRTLPGVAALADAPARAR